MVIETFFKICNFTAEETSNKIMIRLIEKFNFLFNAAVRLSNMIPEMLSVRSHHFTVTEQMSGKIVTVKRTQVTHLSVIRCNTEAYEK